MALQDLCHFQEVFEDDGLTSGCSSELFEKRTACHYMSDFTFSPSAGPFHFYIPVAEYLDESPLEFGQICSTVASRDSFLSSLSPPAPSRSVPLPFPMSHGTTTLAFVFQGGVLAAADTRSSCAGLVADPAAQKILPIHSHLVGTTSGTSADCALWKRILSRELRLYQLRHGRRLSTRGAAKLLSHMLHPFKGTELCVAATLCGWDGGEVDGGEVEGAPGGCPEEAKKLEPSAGPSPDKPKNQSGLSGPSRNKTTSSGPSLFYVCSDGTRLQGTLFSVGSGSPYAYSILDDGVKWGLSLEEATRVAREAVYRATHRDAYSGNHVDVFHVSSAGWRRREREDLKEEYYREQQRPSVREGEEGSKEDIGEGLSGEAVVSLQQILN